MSHSTHNHKIAQNTSLDGSCRDNETRSHRDDRSPENHRTVTPTVINDGKWSEATHHQEQGSKENPLNTESLHDEARVHIPIKVVNIHAQQNGKDPEYRIGDREKEKE